ncbi:RNA recognition motif domain-containing protein [Flavihumibacter petaseus]|uniref:Putative RNA-binding protein n=1 Tax=Flavihumibacter petaseus NBRC 106054 TaxID=1220578 RepID=A0A0E9N075_9BACT|nr:RNA-binding protein [Flavihumibacter petaseus]GAO43183.1 putative RNA-binding protein [Flavihumibacter petaseus NBRC 106054]
MNIYISNLSTAVREADLRDLFSRFGPLQSVKLALESSTGHSRGFGFVEMSRENGLKAIRSLHGKIIEGKAISVAESIKRNGIYG